MQKITTFLWLDSQAEEAAQFYTSLFDDSRIVDVTRYGATGLPGEKEIIQRIIKADGGKGTIRFVTLSTAAYDADKQAADYLASVRRGYELFTAPGQTACVTCHEDFGRKKTFRYDVWGTVVRPADLTAGTYKGGNRPEDLASRIRFGIPPSGMPAHGAMTDAQVADLVRFVRALPYPRELPPDVRSKVYPGQ